MSLKNQFIGLVNLKKLHDKLADMIVFYGSMLLGHKQEGELLVKSRESLLNKPKHVMIRQFEEYKQKYAKKNPHDFDIYCMLIANFILLNDCDRGMTPLAENHQAISDFIDRVPSLNHNGSILTEVLKLVIAKNQEEKRKANTLREANRKASCEGLLPKVSCLVALGLFAGVLATNLLLSSHSNSPSPPCS